MSEEKEKKQGLSLEEIAIRRDEEEQLEITITYDIDESADIDTDTDTEDTDEPEHLPPVFYCKSADKQTSKKIRKASLVEGKPQKYNKKTHLKEDNIDNMQMMRAIIRYMIDKDRGGWENLHVHDLRGMVDPAYVKALNADADATLDYSEDNCRTFAEIASLGFIQWFAESVGMEISGLVEIKRDERKNLPSSPKP